MSWLDKIKAPSYRPDGEELHGSSERIRRRVSMLPTNELVTMVETTVSQIGKNVYDSTREPDEPVAIGHLVEAETGAEALTAMISELRARRASR